MISQYMKYFLLQGQLEHNFQCQPYIWDFPGLPDTECRNISQILRMVLNGN